MTTVFPLSFLLFVFLVLGLCYRTLLYDGFLVLLLQYSINIYYNNIIVIYNIMYLNVLRNNDVR